MNANSALFGKIVDNSTFTNVTIDITSWATPTDNTYTGILGLSQNQNLVLNNVVINVADGITVPQLIGRTFTGATGNVTVNLGVDVTVINYYSTANSGSSGVTTLPSDSIFTVNQKIAQIIDTETIIEGNTMPAADLSDGTVSVLLGGNTYSGTVASGVLTIENLPTATGKLADSVVVTQNDNKYTYTNIWHVTQVIDTVAELKALGTLCKDSVVTGYYILGGDIDCSAEATMSNGSGSGTTNGFQGTFDGRNYTISNITMNGYGGLFGNLLGATIKNTTFDNVNLSTNGSLLAVGADKNSTTSTNTSLKDIVINLSSYNTGYGVVVGYSMFNTVGSGIVINVADGLTVASLLCRDTCNTLAGGYITATVNLGANSTITNYCSGTTTPPSTFTVNTTEVYVPVEETHDELVAGEGTTSLTFTNNLITAGNASVTIDGGAAQTVTATDGSLTVNLGSVAMGQHTVVITTPKGDTLTYTEVWYVTQVIDTVAELKALGTLCKDSVVTGYYILGGDIDCSAEATMSNGSGSTTTNGFSGTFDGRGYTISNIKMTWDSATNGLGGLFGKLLGATIQNTVFDNVNLGTNGTLLASGAAAYNSINVNLKNITINLAGYSTSYGVVVGYGLLNTIGSNVVINVADGLTVTYLLSKENCNSIAYITATVNLGAGSTITNYYGTTTAKPDTITVNAARESTVATVDTLVAGENATSVTFTHNAFADSTSATVVINGVTKENVAITNGAITVDLADYNVSAMGQVKDGAVITTNLGDTLTYTEVWYVTQVIDDATELKALGTLCKDNVVTGYYILGGDIDCSAEATMSNGSASTTTNGFSGTFDGRGKIISNINMTLDSATSGLGGLFGKLLGCTIKNTTFDNVNLGTNGTLLASGADKNSTTNTNTSLQNLTINLTGYTTGYGVVVGYSMFNTVGSGIVINVADGLTVASLMARDNCNSIAYIYATVNLGTGSTITNYYSGATTAPSTFTVTQK